MNSMLTAEEVKAYLDIEEQEFEKHLRAGKLHAYKIGGTYLRFRKEDVVSLRFQIQPSKIKPPAKKNFFSHIADFWRFNNFYILSLLAVLAIVFVMVKS